MQAGSPPLPRDQFPVSSRYRYFNHAGTAPLSLAAADAGHAFLDTALHEGAVGHDEWDRRTDQVRAAAARLMGVPTADIAFVKNTTEGLAFVAGGMDWRSGDRVVTVGREFPTSVYPWLALRDRGVTVDQVQPEGPSRRLTVDAFAAALDAAPTRLVGLSWINYATGWRVDLPALAQLCHDHGALLCVDVIQGLGAIPVQLADWGVDFASADAHKWMLGPLGTGILYVAQDRRDLLRPMEPGWNAVAAREDYDRLVLDFDPSARRFEGGSLTTETILQMGASIELLLDTGIERISTHITSLLDRLAERLHSIGATVLSDLNRPNRSGILTFTAPGPQQATLHARLQSEHIICSPRAGGIRVAPHGYNTVDEIDALVSVVSDEVRR